MAEGCQSAGDNITAVFLEVCGDRPVASYTRADGDAFRTTLRRLPATYRKSPKDRGKSLPQIIEEADANQSPRITDKTVKRHFWALSQYFKFLMESSKLPKAANNVGQGFTFNTRKGRTARNQRDGWEGEELRRLFTSPVWMGCDPGVLSRPRTVRDALFRLPLLGLYRGNRLEAFAQLRREVSALRLA
jgi:hypothetical protein